MPKIMLNSVEYTGGDGDNSMELTYDEYLALPEEEKNDGTTYYIKDINGIGKDQFQPIIYSEEEREIGVWTDGKPLYEKTFIDITLTADQDYTLFASGIERIVSAEHCVVNTSNNTEHVPFYISRYGASGNMSVSASVLNGRMFAINNTNASVVWTGTIRYTKTTDQPGSGTWTPQGVPAVHYSTNEQVVGTWIDGSTIYERTLTSDTVTKGSWTNIGNALTWGIDTVVELVGSYKRTWSSNSMQTIPYYESANVNASVRYHSSQGIQYRINDEVNNSVSKLKVTIRYTKTTS